MTSSIGREGKFISFLNSTSSAKGDKFLFNNLTNTNIQKQNKHLMSIETAALTNATPTCTIAAALLFGTIIFTYASLYSRSHNDESIVLQLASPKSKTLDTSSYTSLYILCHHCTVFGLILYFAYICENHPFYPHGEKSYDRDKFYFVTGILFLVSAYTVTKNDRSSASSAGGSKVSLDNADSAAGSKTGSSSARTIVASRACNEVLNRDQTEEWKGWMQFIFLLYHYYHAEEVYNSIRIMITCYVWMTGFGNFSFFYLKDDYSLIRLIQMLWRLNFLVLFLCLSQGTTYILYYICPLHTYFFLMVFASMRFMRCLNYSKYGLRLKLFLVGVAIFFVWDVDSSLFKLIHMPFLSEEPKLGAGNGTMWEWYFRSSLDHWSTFLGMVFAANFPITSLLFRKLEAQSRTVEVLAKGTIGVAMLAVFGMWVVGPFSQGKLEYNATNAYFGFIPLITYIYFRNLTPTLRSYSIDLLHQIGKTTLETYLMQHHIWLTSDAKSLLILIPGYPYCNFLLVSIIYFYVSRRLYSLTLFLRGMFLPNDSLFFCIKSLIGIAVAVGGYYGMAMLLSLFGLASLTSVGFISITLGFYFYRLVLNKSQDQSRRMSAASSHTPPLFGLLAIFLVGVSWHTMAMYGAGKIQPLPQQCSEYIHQGGWVPIQPCTNDIRGKAARSQHMADISCSTTNLFTWGWNRADSNTLCRFVYRSPKTLSKALANRNIVFVGDSMVRNLYHSTLRSMGMPDKDFDTALLKHSDYTDKIASTNFSFKWAPFTVDQAKVLDDIGSSPENNPDLLILGGGSWDRLHVFDTDPEHTKLKKEVEDLVKQMNTLNKNMPVVWTIPTIINDNDLKDDDKKAHMKENQLDEMRQMQDMIGVHKAATFVLDGRAFSKDRVTESFEYIFNRWSALPPSVYDGGIQILANAFDWILPTSNALPSSAPQPGKMANPYLGMGILFISFIGLFLFDGFMGFSLLAGLFAKNLWTCTLYEEAFGPLHLQMKLPPIKTAGVVIDKLKESEMVGFMSKTNGLDNA